MFISNEINNNAYEHAQETKLKSCSLHNLETYSTALHAPSAHLPPECSKHFENGSKIGEF